MNEQLEVKIRQTRVSFRLVNVININVLRTVSSGDFGDRMFHDGYYSFHVQRYIVVRSVFKHVLRYDRGNVWSQAWSDVVLTGNLADQNSDSSRKHFKDYKSALIDLE